MSLHHVVVPIDFSVPSIAAIAVAKELAARAGADVQLLSISGAHGKVEAEAELRTLAAAAGEGTTWRIVTSEADPETPLVLEILGSSNDTLWCLGSHARTALGELMFGSISADVVREVETGIVLVGPHAVARNSSDVMLVPIDPSDNSEKILASAIEIADALKMRLRLVQVGDHGVPADSSESSFIRHEAMQLPEPHNRDFDVLHGEVESAISRYVEQTADVGMIAMATRGIPAGARLTMGSTALTVLRHAPVPMLILHPGAED